VLKTGGTPSEAENDPEASGAGCLPTWTGSKLHVQFRFLSATSITYEVLHAHQAHFDAGAILIVIRRGLGHRGRLALRCIVDDTAHVGRRAPWQSGHREAAGMKPHPPALCGEVRELELSRELAPLQGARQTES